MSGPRTDDDAPRPFGGAFVVPPWLPATIGPLFGLVVLVVSVLGARWVLPQTRISPVWPADGVAVGLLAILGLRWWPALLVAGIVQPLLSGLPGGVGVGLGVLNCASAVVIVQGLRRRTKGPAPWVDQPSGMLRLAAVAVLVNAIAAAGSILVLEAGGLMARGQSLVAAWRTWWLADTLGVLLVTPPLLAWLAPRATPSRQRGTTFEAALLSAATLLAGWLVFFGPFLSGRSAETNLILLVPLVVCAAVRFGLRGATTSVLTVCVLALLSITVDPTISSPLERGIALVYTQAFAAVLAVTGCVLGGAVVARESAEVEVAGRDDQIRRLVDAVPSVLFRFSLQRNGGVTLRLLSDGVERIMGVSAAEIEQDLPRSLQRIADEDRASVIASIGRAATQLSAWSAQFRIIAADGSTRWVRAQSVPDSAPLADGTRVWNGVITDITAERPAELFEAEQARVLEALAVGGSRQEALDLIVRLVDGQLPGGHSAIWVVEADVLRLGATELVPPSLRALADGAPIASRGSLAAQVVASGERMLIEDVLRDPRGAEMPTTAREAGIRTAWLVPFWGAGGRLLGVLSVYFTEQRRAARRDLGVLDAVATLAGLVVQRFEADQARRTMEDQLERAQRMESLGRLAGGIAHDFNNLLTVITNSAALLEAELPDGSAAREDVDQIRHSTARAAGLVRQMLAFGRRQPWQPQQVQIGQIVQRLLPVIRGVLGERHALDLQLASDLPDVLADVGQLEQVIINLVMNARDAMEAAPGTLTIATESLGDRSARMVIRDTGHGMTEAVRARIFEPFYTTKVVGQGTGLGLSMVFAIIERSGGVVRVESEPGAGASFIFEWPMAKEAADASGPIVDATEAAH